jgi:hypothetical protein
VAIRGRCGPATSLGAIAKSAWRASERGIALELVDVVRRAEAVHVGDVAVVDVCVRCPGYSKIMYSPPQIRLQINLLMFFAQIYLHIMSQTSA